MFLGDMNSQDIKYRSVQIEPTNRCNLRCRACWHTLGDVKKSDNLNFSFFKIIIDQFNGIRDLNLQGLGEPFLAPDLLRMITYAAGKGISVWLTSNFNTDMNKEFAQEVVRSGIAKIRISVDASSENQYSYIKRGGSLQKVINAISLFNKVKNELSSNFPVLAFNTIAMKSNIKDLKNIIILAHSLDIREIALIPLVVFNKGLANKRESLSADITLVKQYIEEIYKTARELGIELEEGVSAMMLPKEMNLTRNEEPKCASGCYIDCLGFLYPCCNVKYFLGNFNDNRLIEMINSPRYQFFQENILTKKIDCASCMEILNKG